MNFLEYSNVAASHVRNALKEPLRSQAQNRNVVHFRERLWTGGVGTCGGACFYSRVFSPAFAFCPDVRILLVSFLQPRRKKSKFRRYHSRRQIKEINLRRA